MQRKKKTPSYEENGNFTGLSGKDKKAIEEALSEAMTDKTAPTYREYEGMSRSEKMMDRLKNKAISIQDEGYDKLLEGRGTQRYSKGGDVRFNSNRGKTY